MRLSCPRVTKIAGQGSPEAPLGGHWGADDAFQKCFKNQPDIDIGVVVVTLLLHLHVVFFMLLLFEAMPTKMAKTETRQTLQIPGCQRRVEK